MKNRNGNPKISSANSLNLSPPLPFPSLSHFLTFYLLRLRNPSFSRSLKYHFSLLVFQIPPLPTPQKTLIFSTILNRNSFFLFRINNQVFNQRSIIFHLNLIIFIRIITSLSLLSISEFTLFALRFNRTLSSFNFLAIHFNCMIIIFFSHWFYWEFLRQNLQIGFSDLSYLGRLHRMKHYMGFLRFFFFVYFAFTIQILFLGFCLLFNTESIIIDVIESM